MKGFLFVLASLLIASSVIWGAPAKDDLWYTTYDEAWQIARAEGKPLYILVANESSDPWQMSLFKRVAVRDTLKGFVPLLISPYEDLAFRLPIKSLPATFIISPQGEALLSYQGLLWEAEFFQVVAPLSAEVRTYEKVAGISLPSRKELINVAPTGQTPAQPAISGNEFPFKDGFFRYDGKNWQLNYQKQNNLLKVSSWKVANFLLLEDEKKGMMYAVPLEDKYMSYQMNRKTEIWEPFYLIQKK